MTTVALAATGEMGAAIGKRMEEFGGLVLCCQDGRSQASLDRGRIAGVETASQSSVLERADIYLSIVPSAVAEQVAERFITAAAKAVKVPTYIDCNAIAPMTLYRIAERFKSAGLNFGDGAIIGGPPRSGWPSPRIYLSGPMCNEAGALYDLGLDARHMSAMPGDASALKMGYAGLTKGLQALAAGVLAGADDANGLDCLIAEVRQSLPGLYGFLATNLPKMPRKAGRWEQEMREIAMFMPPGGGAAAMFEAAAAEYHEIAIALDKPSSNIPALIDRFVAASRKT